MNWGWGVVEIKSKLLLLFCIFSCHLVKFGPNLGGRIKLNYVKGMFLYRILKVEHGIRKCLSCSKRSITQRINRKKEKTAYDPSYKLLLVNFLLR